MKTLKITFHGLMLFVLMLICHFHMDAFAELDNTAPRITAIRISKPEDIELHKFVNFEADVEEEGTGIKEISIHWASVDNYTGAAPELNSI